MFYNKTEQLTTGSDVVSEFGPPFSYTCKITKKKRFRVSIFLFHKSLKEIKFSKTFMH